MKILRKHLLPVIIENGDGILALLMNILIKICRIPGMKWFKSITRYKDDSQNNTLLLAQRGTVP